MAGQKILFECHNLTLSAGTGIATYARNLSKEAKVLGYETAGLFGVEPPYSSGSHYLDEIRLFDALRERDNSPIGVARRLWKEYRADPEGVVASEAKLPGIVIQPNGGSFYAGFDQAYLTEDLMGRARRHFYRHNRLMPVAPIPGVSLMHTTHVVPLVMPGVPTICTIHDIIPLRLPYTTLDDKGYFFRLVETIVARADHVVTVSEHSKRDLITYFGTHESRITNTYQSVEIDLAVLALSEDELAHDLAALHDVEPGEYYIFVGAIEPKKNVSRIIDAYAASGSRRPLLIAGGLGWMYENDVRKMEDPRFAYQKIANGEVQQRRRVQHCSYLSRQHLLKLMRGARALIFPSLYEGFGLPVLEAMTLGTPVITSRTSSLPEVAGDAALLVDPFDVDDITKAIRKMDQDGDLRTELIQRGHRQAALFSPEVYRERLAALYRNVLGSA